MGDDEFREGSGRFGGRHFVCGWRLRGLWRPRLLQRDWGGGCCMLRGASARARVAVLAPHPAQHEEELNKDLASKTATVGCGWGPAPRAPKQGFGSARAVGWAPRASAAAGAYPEEADGQAGEDRLCPQTTTTPDVLCHRVANALGWFRCRRLHGGFQRKHRCYGRCWRRRGGCCAALRARASALQGRTAAAGSRLALLLLTTPSPLTPHLQQVPHGIFLIEATSVAVDSHDHV